MGTRAAEGEHLTGRGQPSAPWRSGDCWDSFGLVNVTTEGGSRKRERPSAVVLPTRTLIAEAIGASLGTADRLDWGKANANGRRSTRIGDAGRGMRTPDAARERADAG